MSLSKQYLKNPERIAQIKSHRQKRKELDPPRQPHKIRVIEPEPFIKYDYGFARGHLKDLHEIYLSRVTGRASFIYDDHFLELTIIEEHYFEYSRGDYASAYNFLVEDKNGSVITLQVFGLPENENTREMFAVGTKLFLVHPFVRLDFKPFGKSRSWIRVDETKTKNLIVVGKKEDMCHYCGEENAKNKCGNCRQNYCGRECQLADWKVLKHKLVCKIKDDANHGLGTEENGASSKSKKTVSVSSSSPAPAGTPNESLEETSDNHRKIRFAPSYLENPRRLHSLWIRMKNLATLIPSLPGVDYDFMFANDPAEKPFIPPKLTKPMDSDLKPTYLKDMKYEDFYEGKFIELTIIEEPFMADPKAVFFVVGDSNMDVCNLVIYGVPVSRRDKTLERFLFGAKLKVMNPVYKIRDADMLPMIMVDGLKMIKYLEKKVDMCRYCGKENATMKCSNCNHSYCGRKCQLADWNVLKHELVCCKTDEKKGDLKMRPFFFEGRAEKDSGEAKPSEKDGIMKSSKETSGGSQTQIVEGTLNTAKKTTSSDKPKQVTPSHLHPALMNPVRHARIWNLRMKFNFNMRVVPIFTPGFLFPGDSVVDTFIPPKMTKPLELKPIYLKNMKHNHFHESKFIEVTIIEEPLLGYAAIHFVVEDKNKDVSNMAVNGLPQSKETCSRMSFGTKWMVVNPVYKIGAVDKVPMIRVDDLKMLVYLGKKVDMCRFCGEEYAKVKCGNCKRMYCGKECQVKDWDVLKHKLVCDIGPFP